MAQLGIETLDRLLRRCVTCVKETPSCPACEDGYVCKLSSEDCNTCASTSCVKNETPTIAASTSSSHGGPNGGAIAGGVIGGVAVVAIVTYLVWRFCIKTRRQQYEQENWVEELEGDSVPNTEEKSTFTMQRDARASTYTVGSIASTVLTRASNIIQIAYIPGVTNRSAPSTPGLLVPPVPPIPIALSSAGTTPLYNDQHFFMPGDLRDSTYSGISDRTSYARTSVASTIYGKNAIISPVPAQTSKVIRGKAAVVSVGSKTASSSLSTGDITPPVPSLDYSKYQAGPPSPAFSVGSTFLTNASAATAMKPTVVSVTPGSKGSGLSKVENSFPDEPYRDFPTQTLIRSYNRNTMESSGSITTFIDDASNPNSPRSQGPFADPKDEAGDSTVTLGRVIKAATRKATARPVSGLATRTPFGDEHATDE